MRDTLERIARQQLLQLRAFQNKGVPANVARELARRGRIKQSRVEEFWAGRNHAMRRSARVAA